MSQITSGIRSILSHPLVYDAFQNLMGAKRARAEIVQRYIRPFPGMRILDIGCGTCEMLHFLPDGVFYHGYDISEEYIAHAQKTFGSRGAFDCKLFDAQEASKLAPFDLVMAIGVLHHLSDGEARHFMALAKTALKPGARVLTRDPVYAGGQNPVAKFLIDRDRGQHVRKELAYRALAEGIFNNISGHVTHQSWVPYTHFTMECSN